MVERPACYNEKNSLAAPPPEEERTVTAEERRKGIEQVLSQSPGPVSAAALARRFGVSRQIIVGDVALLRAAGAAIDATPRGYVTRRGSVGLVRQVACRHTAADMEQELNIMVDNGCTVLDVAVDHPVYGQLTGALHLRSRYDVKQFVARCAEAQPLSVLTEGIHLHTLVCPDGEAWERVRAALAAAGFLLEET